MQELKDVLKGKKLSEGSSVAEEVANETPGELPPVGDQELNEEIKLLEEKLKESENKIKEQNEKYLRQLAEFDNFRKRIEKEKGESLQFANERLLKELLPVLDHLEMTIDHAENFKSADAEPLVTGVSLVIKQFVGVLEKFGVTPITGEGKEFDPHLQESVGMVDSEKYPGGTVVTVLRKGYKLQHRVIRAALVNISKGSPEEENTENTKIH